MKKRISTDKYFSIRNVTAILMVIALFASFIPSTDTSAYAQTEKCKITFYKNDGTGEIKEDNEHNVGEEYQLPLCDFQSPEGKYFYYWQVEGEANLKSPGDDIVLSKKELAIKAIWKGYFEKQPESKSALVGTPIKVDWKSADHAFAVNLQKKGIKEDWSDKTETNVTGRNDYIFPASNVPKTETYRLEVNGSYSNEFTVKWTELEKPVITTGDLPRGKIGVQYTQKIMATGSEPMNWSIGKGELPQGLVLEEFTGVISGIPTKVGKFAFAVKVSNDINSYAVKNMIINVDKKDGPAAPNCSFSFDGMNAGKLMGSTADMEYSLDGSTYKDCGTNDVMLDINSISADKDIKVRIKETGTAEAGAVQTIDITKASVPAVTKTNCTKESNDNGTLIGVSNKMEWKKNDGNWADGTGNVIEGLKNGIYHVRVKASGTAMASDIQTLQIAEFHKSNGGGFFVGSNSNSNSQNKYSVTIEKTENGKITIDRESASENQTVTITALPDKGYKIGKITVMYKNGKEIKPDEINGKYSFKMPAGNVSIKAVFEKDKQSDENPFNDVNKTDYYYEAMKWAVKKNITSGTGEKTFSPAASCNRAETATFLWRAAGSPEPKTAINQFVDVKEGAYYYKAVLWAIENKITYGTSQKEFSPDNKCNRAEIATFLYRFAKSPEVKGSNPFRDVNAADYYKDAVIWAASKGISNGTSPNEFSPNAACTRGQMVTFLYRYMKM